MIHKSPSYGLNSKYKRGEKEVKYYALERKENKADLYIFGAITSYPWRDKDRDAYGIVQELAELDTDELNVHINSNGGAVSEGLAIYNVLKNSKAKVTTYCDGFACSAASVIFMAGNKRIMNSASLLMVHNAWTYGEGNAAELRKQADDLETITQASVNAYMNCVTITEDEVKKMMDEETWITAEKAVEYGFATSVYEDEEEGISQSAQMSIRNKILSVSNLEAESINLGEILKVDSDEIARKVVELLEKKEEKTSTGWSAFFNGGKK